MNKGDRFVVEIEVHAGCKDYNIRDGANRYNLVGGVDHCNLWDAEVEKAAKAYAAKQTPAPTPAGWTPKKGERVLIEAEVISVYEDAPRPYEFSITSRGCRTHGWAEQSQIIGPAPVQVKFAVGQLVFSIKQQAVIEIDHYDSEKEIYFSAWQYGIRVSGKQDDFMSLDEAITPEAREKLAK